METKKALTTKNKNSYKSATNYGNNCNKNRNNKYPALDYFGHKKLQLLYFYGEKQNNV